VCTAAAACVTITTVTLLLQLCSLVQPALIMPVCEQLCETAIPLYLSRLTSEQLKHPDRFATRYNITLHNTEFDSLNAADYCLFLRLHHADVK
jgi:hypothetical protein